MRLNVPLLFGLFRAELGKCELSQMNSGYAEHFIEYRQGAMDDDIKESANSPYSLATATLDDLLMFEETGVNKREYRTSEMHQLYSVIHS